MYSPSLRSEVTRFVLKNTLGKLPLFTQTLDPEFQMEVFPLIKPVSFTKGDTFTAVKKVGQWYVARDGAGNEGLVQGNFVTLREGAMAESSL